MRTPNLSFGRARHLNVVIRRVPESPVFLFPSPYWLPRHDVNLEIEGVSVGLCFLRWIFQLNLRKASWLKKNPNVDLSRAAAIAAMIAEEFGQPPDPPSIVDAFEKNKWLRDMAARGAETTFYGLKIIKDAAREEQLRRNDESAARRRDHQPSERISIEGIS